MKKQNQLIMSAASLAVLVVLFVLLQIGGKEDTTEDAGEEPTTAISYTVFSAEESEIAAVTITAEETVTLTQADGIWSVNALTSGEADADKIAEVIGYIAALSSDTLAASAPEDLSEYGLDVPRATVEVTLTDGDSGTLYLGATSPTLGEVFVKTAGGVNVYTIDSYKAEAICRTEVDYRTFSRIKLLGTDIVAVEIETTEGVFHAELKPTEEQTSDSKWQATYNGVTYNTSNDYIKSGIISALKTLDIATPAREGADYGLNPPEYTVTVTIRETDDDGVYSGYRTEVITIGAQADEDCVYVGYNGGVYEVAAEDLEFVETTLNK